MVLQKSFLKFCYCYCYRFLYKKQCSSHYWGRLVISLFLLRDVYLIHWTASTDLQICSVKEQLNFFAVFLLHHYKYIIIIGHHKSTIDFTGMLDWKSKEKGKTWQNIQLQLLRKKNWFKNIWNNQPTTTTRKKNA